jgi:hypothetical protein
MAKNEKFTRKLTNFNVSQSSFILRSLFQPNLGLEGLIPRIFTFPAFRVFHNSKRTQHFQFGSTVFKCGKILREASQLQFQIRSSSFRLNLEPEAWRSCSNGLNSTKRSPILTIIFFILLQEKDYHISQSLSRYCF